MPLERRQRRGIALIAAAALACSVASSPPASAQPPDAAGTVAATVKSIHAPATPPSPPKTTPPASVTPPASAAPPPSVAPPPRAPATSGAPAELPARAAPTHSPPSSTGSAAKPPAINRTGDVAGSLGGVVTSAGEGVRAKAPSVHTDSVGSSAHPRGLQADPRDAIPSINAESGAKSSAPTSSAPPSIRGARVAALQRWFAHIWPAIPLGGALGGGTGRSSAVATISRNLLRPAVAAAARTLILALSNKPLPVDSPFAGDPGTANSRHPSLPASPTAADGKRILYLVALAALLALLAFTIWREFNSALRAGGRHL